MQQTSFIESPETQRLPFEQWAKLKGTAAHWLNGARVGNRWPQGFEMAEADFDAAIHAAQNVVVR